MLAECLVLYLLGSVSEMLEAAATEVLVPAWWTDLTPPLTQVSPARM